MNKTKELSYIFLALLLFICASLGLLSELRGQQRDRVILDAPVFKDAGATTFRLSVLHIDWLAEELIVGLQQSDSDGEFIKVSPKTMTFSYRGAEMNTVVRAILTDSITVGQVQDWFLKRLQTEGKIGAGAILK